MTTTTPQIAARRPLAKRLRLVLFPLLLSGLALPAFAAPGLASDSAEQVRPASASLALGDSNLLPERSRVEFASDVNAAIAAQDGKSGAQPSSRMQTLLQRGLTLLGTPYRWGGTSPDGGFDCSGLVGYVFRTALGIELPRVSRDMADQGKLISDRAALVAGDLVFFASRGKRVDHVGIYMGEGRFLHAPRTGKDVQVDSLATGYWSGKFLQARRVAEI